MAVDHDVLKKRLLWIPDLPDSGRFINVLSEAKLFYEGFV